MPTNLDFLLDYSHLVLYCPADDASNLRIALPNKYFQAIAHGLRIIVSENFREIIEFSRPVPGLVKVLRDPSDLSKYIADSAHFRDPLYTEQINQFAKTVYRASMNQYQDLILHG